jgi:uncharacterized protein
MNQRFDNICHKLQITLLVLALAVCLWPNSLSAKPFPEPVGYVNDFAKVISPDIASKISAVARELDTKTGTQIVVATFPDLGGEDIDGFTVRLFEQWTPGQAKRNNGLMIVDAIAERKLKIEIGYGLEPIITDAVTGRIRRDEMTPLLQAGQRGEAYLIGVVELAKIIAKDEGVTLTTLGGGALGERERGRRNRPFNFITLPILIIIAIVLAITRRNRRGGGGGFRGGAGPFIGGMLLGGGLGGFGGGGFSGGGGGFGGFGGGFSGGGGSSGGY